VRPEERVGDYLESLARGGDIHEVEIVRELVKSGHPSPWARNYVRKLALHDLRYRRVGPGHEDDLKLLLGVAKESPDYLELLYASALLNWDDPKTFAVTESALLKDPNVKTQLGLYLAKLLALDGISPEAKRLGLRLIARYYPNTPEIQAFLKGFRKHPVEEVARAAAESLDHFRERSLSAGEPRAPGIRERRSFAKKFGLTTIPPHVLRAEPMYFADAVVAAAADISRWEAPLYSQVPLARFVNQAMPYAASDRRVVPALLAGAAGVGGYQEDRVVAPLRVAFNSYSPEDPRTFEALMKLAERTSEAGRLALALIERHHPHTRDAVRSLERLVRLNRNYHHQDLAKTALAAVKARPYLATPYSFGRDTCRPAYLAVADRVKAYAPVAGFAALFGSPIVGTAWLMAHEIRLDREHEKNYRQWREDMSLLKEEHGLRLFANLPSGQEYELYALLADAARKGKLPKAPEGRQVDRYGNRIYIDVWLSEDGTERTDAYRNGDLRIKAASTYRLAELVVREVGKSWAEKAKRK
jgi:hypothetical protein